MFFYTIRSWGGAALTDTWSFFVLFGLSVAVFATIEPDPAHGKVLSAAVGIVVGWLLGADLVRTVNRVHGLPASARSRVIGFLLVVSSAAVFTWATPADPASSPIFTSVPMFFVPAAVMGAVYFLAGLALVDR